MATISLEIKAPIRITSSLFFIAIIADVKKRLKLSYVTLIITLILGTTNLT